METWDVAKSAFLPNACFFPCFPGVSSDAWMDETAADDVALFKIVEAAANVLKVSQGPLRLELNRHLTCLMLTTLLDTVWQVGGEGFVDYIKGTDYQKLLQMGGSSFADLLRNINSLHSTSFLFVIDNCLLTIHLRPHESVPFPRHVPSNF